ncbi:unnamed protein product [Caenorhabditis angaria]|uniref:Uncharacterized protein n=1 Tax=Caenorhabditis angaria TaxID=860376 RepID=A0A9P1ITU6_9PELO|nr:unnamed protein product [Caenorhabditis angaria]
MPFHPKSIVVTGSNRGIGFGLVQNFLKDPQVEKVIATARNVENAEKLKEIKDSRLHILPLDITSDSSINEFIEKLSEKVGDSGVDLLVNNAAVLIPYTTTQTPNRRIIQELFEVNTISVVILTQKMFPLLEKSKQSHSGIVTITSEMLGSIELNTTGSGRHEAMAYRMTKTAINQFIKTISIDLKNANSRIFSIGICPGWVQTDMGGTDGKLTIDESTSQIVSSINNLEPETHNGGYFRRDLTKIPY